MPKFHSIIVPGVGGSNEHHWQSWIEKRLSHVTRVEQNWDQPILNQWVDQWINVIQSTDLPVQVIAHSFGCLTSIAALAEHPTIQHRIKKLILVAPANPIRFSETGFAHTEAESFFEYFKQIQITVLSIMLISENDPWLEYEDAKYFAEIWKIPYVNLGKVGHINVDAGFGAFPELLPHLLSKPKKRILDSSSYSILKSHQHNFLVESL